MKHTIYFTFCILLCLSSYTQSFAQGGGNAVTQEDKAMSTGNYLYNQNDLRINDRITIPVNQNNTNVITLKADVMMNIQANSYTAIFAISQSGASVSETDSLMQGRINQVMFGLNQLGIPDDYIHVDAVSAVPTYAYNVEDKKFSRRSIEMPTGFEMKKNIHILFKKHSMLDPIISQMAFAEVYDLVKVEYNIDGTQSYVDELRRAAIEVVQAKQGTYTDFHFHLDVAGVTDGSQVTYPMERYKSYTAYNTGSTLQTLNTASASNNNNIWIEGKNNTLQIDNTRSKLPEKQYYVQSAEKNKTIYYDRIPYNQFDKVMNADTEEPCIQLSYELQVTYTMLSDEAWQAQQEYKKQQKDQRDLQQRIYDEQSHHREKRFHGRRHRDNYPTVQ